MGQERQSSLGTAIVTGASSGIGKVYADRLASRGFDLLLIARRKDRLQTIASEIESRHQVRVRLRVADLAAPDELTAVTQELAQDSSITMLVNNAGISSVEPVVQASVETFVNLVALNVTALTLLTRSVLPGFIERNAGTIVNVGSVVGFTGFAWAPVYGGTKAYVLNFTQGLKQQLASTKIRFQYVAPAATASEIWDKMGVPISSVEAVLMDTEACVDASLKGLDMGEFITAPSVHDDSLIFEFEQASSRLLAATETAHPAPRYLTGS